MKKILLTTFLITAMGFSAGSSIETVSVSFKNPIVKTKTTADQSFDQVLWEAIDTLQKAANPDQTMGIIELKLNSGSTVIVVVNLGAIWQLERGIISSRDFIRDHVVFI